MRSRLFLLLAALAAVGCGSQPYQLAPVSGVDPQHPGGVVGINRVFISTLEEGTRDAPDAGGMKTFRDRVPARYNQETKLVYDVPPEGTGEADFDLKVP